MGLTLIGVASRAGGSSYVSTLDCDTTLDVQAGDLLVGVAGFRSSSPGLTEPSIAQTSGSNSLTAAGIYNPGGIYERSFYRLIAEAGLGATFRATFGATRQYAALCVLQFRPGAGETVDVEAAYSPNGATSASAETGQITTSKAALVVGGIQLNADGTLSSFAVNGQAADNSYSIGTRFGAWYKNLAAAASNFRASVTINSSMLYSAAALAFSVSGGGLSIPVAMNHLKNQGVA